MCLSNLLTQVTTDKFAAAGNFLKHDFVKI